MSSSDPILPLWEEFRYLQFLGQQRVLRWGSLWLGDFLISQHQEVESHVGGSGILRGQRPPRSHGESEIQQEARFFRVEQSLP